MKTLITIPEEMAAWIGQYMKEHMDELSKDELDLLESCRTNPGILQVMGYSFFIEWDNCTTFIRPSVRSWTEETINFLLEAEA